MVPLVFKTSLGVVRSPEGSTPSLLRHKNIDKFNADNLRLRLRPIVARMRLRGSRFTTIHYSVFLSDDCVMK